MTSPDTAPDLLPVTEPVLPVRSDGRIVAIAWAKTILYANALMGLLFALFTLFGDKAATGETVVRFLFSWLFFILATALFSLPFVTVGAVLAVPLYKLVKTIPDPKRRYLSWAGLSLLSGHALFMLAQPLLGNGSFPFTAISPIIILYSLTFAVCVIRTERRYNQTQSSHPIPAA